MWPLGRHLGYPTREMTGGDGKARAPVLYSQTLPVTVRAGGGGEPGRRQP